MYKIWTAKVKIITTILRCTYYYKSDGEDKLDRFEDNIIPTVKFVPIYVLIEPNGIWLKYEIYIFKTYKWTEFFSNINYTHIRQWTLWQHANLFKTKFRDARWVYYRYMYSNRPFYSRGKFWLILAYYLKYLQVEYYKIHTYCI